MPGKERGGFANSAKNLHVGVLMIVTPDEKTDIVMLDTLKSFFTDIGFADFTLITPDEYDRRIIAFTSQLAHVLSAHVRWLIGIAQAARVVCRRIP